MVRLGIPVLLLIIEGKIVAFTVEHDVSYGFVTYCPYHVETYSFDIQFVLYRANLFDPSFSLKNHNNQY